MNFREPLVQTTGRITLTKTQAKLPEIQQFIELLVQIAADGVVSYEELQTLTEWLNTHKECDVSAVKYLFQLLLRVCEDGKITDDETFEIQLGIERILPKEYRIQITEKRKSVYYNQPASDSQLELIQKMTGSRPLGLTRSQASETLDSLFNNYSNSTATPRQIMFLRFWNRVDLISRTRQEISEWMSSFINEDQTHWAVWQLFKDDVDDDGSQRDPSFVPIGACEKYLKTFRRTIE